MTLANDIATISNDAIIFHTVAHGDVNTAANTEHGPVPSLAKAIAQIITAGSVTFGTGANADRLAIGGIPQGPHLTGPAGPQGIQGPQGQAITGPSGPQGTQWRTGNTAPIDADGSLDGDLYLNYSTGIFYKKVTGHYSGYGNLTGPQGFTGPAGPQGTVGSAGPVGPQGPAGSAVSFALSTNRPDGGTVPDGSLYYFSDLKKTYVLTPIAKRWSACNSDSVVGVLGPSGWTKHNWTAVAASQDGVSLAAVAIGSKIYLSSDSGNTWTAAGNTGNWRSICTGQPFMSLSRLAAVGFGQIFTSADFGTTWIAYGPSLDWRGIACDSWGQQLVAVAYGGQIYASTNYGVTWIARDSARNWIAVSMSQDGTKMVAAVYGGQLYTSTDSGVTWTARDSVRNWKSVCISGNGTVMFATIDVGSIYKSTDGGVTWNTTTIAAGAYCIATSYDGTKVFSGGTISYISLDTGATWNNCSPTLAIGPGTLNAIACDSLGRTWIAGFSTNEFTYVSRDALPVGN